MQLQILILAQHQFHTDQQKILRQKGYWQILKLHSAQSEVIGWHTKSHNHFYAFFSYYCHCMRLLNANHKTNQTAQGREKSDWNEKSPNTIKCDLSLSQSQETTSQLGKLLFRQAGPADSGHLPAPMSLEQFNPSCYQHPWATERFTWPC